MAIQQTPERTGIYKYLDIPDGEYFNPDRPSLEMACGGNKTAGNILNYVVAKACNIASKNKQESCNVVSISINRGEILKALRISERTLITHWETLNNLKYIDSPRYSRGECTVNLEAINNGINNPPTQKQRGRPKGTKSKTVESGSNLSEENTSTLSENTSTYIKSLENKVEALTEKLKVLQDKVESISTFWKYFQDFWKYFQLSNSNEHTPQEAAEAFSKMLDYLDSIKTNIDNTEQDQSCNFATTTSQDEGNKSNDLAILQQQEGKQPIPLFPEKPTAPPKRKPNKPKPDNELQARIDRVYEAFDSLFQEVTEDATSKYNRTQKATEAIKELLVCNPTPENLRLVYLHLWNTPATEKFSWRDNMTIAAICHNYDRTLAAVKGKKQPVKVEKTKKLPGFDNYNVRKTSTG